MTGVVVDTMRALISPLSCKTVSQEVLTIKLALSTITFKLWFYDT